MEKDELLIAAVAICLPNESEYGQKAIGEEQEKWQLCG